MLDHALFTVHVSIFFNTGIILVDGDHKYWLENEYPKLSVILETQKEPDNGEQGEPYEKLIDELSTSIECLWQKNEELVTIINNQDEVIQKIVERCQATELEVNKHDLESITEAIEKLCEQKISATITLMAEDSKQELKKQENAFNIKMQNLHTKIENEHQSTQIEIDDINKNYLRGTEEIFKDINRKIEKIEELYSSIERDVELNSVKRLASEEEMFTHQRTEKPKKEIVTTEEKNSKQPGNAISSHENRNTERKADIIMFFDSNGKHIDRKRLWRLDNSEFVRCGQLNKVSKYITETNICELNYLLLNVGCNDLDQKNHDQVFGELELLLDQIRTKYTNIKFIISEITPRHDDRDEEVKLFNALLVNYAANKNDTTFGFHHNLRDTNWSMFADVKHIHSNKIAKYAANIIRALKKAYSIENKKELFNNSEPPRPLMSQPVYYQPSQMYPISYPNSNGIPIGNKFQQPRFPNSPQIPHCNISQPSTYPNIYNLSMGERLHKFAGYERSEPHQNVPEPRLHSYNQVTLV